MAKIDKLLTLQRNKSALELHLRVGQRPALRLSGEVITVATQPVFTEETLREVLLEICPADRLDELTHRHATHFGYGVDGVGRFRCHCFEEHSGLAASFRLVPDKIPPLAELGLPPLVEKFPHFRDGLVLVAGPPRSGRTTTLASLISVINHTYRKHILCVEDPIEYSHPVRKGVLTQREVMDHSISVRTALRSAIYEDVEVLLVADLPDQIAIGMALDAADRGILVFTSITADGVLRTLQRIPDPFPADAQPRIRSLFADTLRGVIALNLVPGADGRTRYPAPEVLLSNPMVADKIREGDFERLPSLLSTGRGDWYFPPDLALQELVSQGKVAASEAYFAAQNKAAFERLLAR